MMEKQKRWQLYLIIAVLAITLYNILPTLFFYSKPLKSPIDGARSSQVAGAVVERVNKLVPDSKDWLASFCNLLGVKPLSIDLVPSNEGLIDIAFRNDKDAALFRRFLPKAGELIPFIPAQLGLSPETASLDSSHVLVQRGVSFELDPGEMSRLFQFTPKYSQDKHVADLYRDLIYDRVSQLALAIGGPGKNALQMSAAVNLKKSSKNDELSMDLAQGIVDISKAFGKDSSIAKRYFASFSQINRERQAGYF